MITVDSREKSRVPELIEKLGIPITRMVLTVGDYTILGPTLSVCISLKSVGDYLGSIHNEHINDELYQMSACYNRSILIVYGNLDEELLYRKIKRETYFEYLAGVVTHISYAGLQGTTSVVNFTTEYDVAMFLKTLHNLIITDDIYREPSVQKVKVTEENRALINVSKLPGVGPIRAKKLIKHFKSIRNIYNATAEELQEVEGVGKVIASGIVEFVNKTHEENVECYQTQL